MKDELKLYTKNLPGWRTRRKIVVFISDDWGDMRIRNEEDYFNLIKLGVPVDKSVHTKYGTLATDEDLYPLFEVLNKVKDNNGNNAVLTPFVILTNPDFDKIRRDNFVNYHYEVFTESISRRERGGQTLKAWEDGIEAGIFVPEFHGREHFNVIQWLKCLREGDEKLLNAFELHYSYLMTPRMKVNPVFAFYYSNNDEFQFLKDSLVDGVRIFRNSFNRPPSVFNPPNGMFHTAFYDKLAESGIQAINTKHFRMQPQPGGRIGTKYFKFGQISKEGILHFISNCAFEPVSEQYKGIDMTIRQVEIAFKCRKPALINTHRVNFVGSRESSVREKGLKELLLLLGRIKRLWPDVEFLSAGDFVKIMKAG